MRAACAHKLLLQECLVCCLQCCGEADWFTAEVSYHFVPCVCHPSPNILACGLAALLQLGLRDFKGG